MSQADEQRVRHLMDLLGKGEAGHDEALQLFAEDASYFMNAWQRPHVGRAAIRAELVRQLGAFADLRSEIVTIASTDERVFVERLDAMTIGGRPVTLHFAGVFDVDASGAITSWRDYFDMSEVAAAVQPPLES
jgi:limonene-1,2-epoxide hydrolase